MTSLERDLASSTEHTTVAASDGGRAVSVHSLGPGAAPGILLVHGAMQSAESQLDLARLLATRRRVHLIDRRGAGDAADLPADPREPGPWNSREVDDVRAVLDATGAAGVFGVSSGAIVAARAALADERITHLVLFEPPLVIDGSARLDLLPRFDRATAAGRTATAMGVAMKIAEMGPAWMFGLPVPVLASLSRGMLRSPQTRRRAAALPADFGIVRENADRIADFAAVRARTLVLSGSATRPYLRTAAGALAATIPGAEHRVLDGQWHSATQNRVERGRPDLVAPAVLDFLA